MDRLSMRSPIIFLLTLLLIVGCDQAPTSLEEEPYRAPQESDELTLEIVELDFDPLGKSFFFSISATSPLSDLEVVASLTSGSSFAYFELSDDGLGDDIIINDGIFNGNWQLPDSLDAYIDSSWTLEVEATVRAQSKLAQRQLTPVRPAPPLILSVSHADTLTLHPTAWVVDTMTVAVEHPQGLDEIRDVSLLSLKPDSTFANSGQPIPLYDDGGSEIFYSFNGIDYTSGDQQAGDGFTPYS